MYAKLVTKCECHRSITVPDPAPPFWWVPIVKNTTPVDFNQPLPEIAGTFEYRIFELWSIEDSCYGFPIAIYREK